MYFSDLIDYAIEMNKMIDTSIVIGNKKINFQTPKVMGILNLTPDSFFDGGRHNKDVSYLTQVEKMLNEGADFIDMGAVSTRPGSISVNEEEELERLLAPLEKIKKHFPETIISVDTYRARVAKEVVANGAHMINDISGGTFDKEMLGVIKDLDVPYILMHIQGNPSTMQENPIYADVVSDVYQFFTDQLNKLAQLGVSNNIIIDPGFGFGKTVKHNFQLLASLSTFNAFGVPVMAGVSRKSMINKVIKTKPENALNGTTVLNTIALLNGANILRVHDVKEAREAIKLVEEYKSN